MQKNNIIRKGLTVGIILLFIGSIEATYINVCVVHASKNNTLVAMTTEWCGSNERGQRTVLLTKQQVSEVEHLLRNIQDCMKGGITKEDLVVRFKNAMVALNSFGLLPKGMTIEQCLHMIQGESTSLKWHAFREKMIHRNSLVANQSNYFCFISGTITNGFVTGPLKLFGIVLTLLALIVHLDFIAQLGLLLMGISNFITTISPVSILQRVDIKAGTLTSFGLNGVQHFNISDVDDEGIISGFTGIKLGSNETGQMHLLGVAIAIET